MGRRSEQRIAVSLPVTVRGLNPHGAPFEIMADTRDISFSGACLAGLNDVVSAGGKIELESHGRKAWYRVAWIGENGSAYAGLIGPSAVSLPGALAISTSPSSPMTAPCVSVVE